MSIKRCFKYFLEEFYLYTVSMDSGIFEIRLLYLNLRAV